MFGPHVVLTLTSSSGLGSLPQQLGLVWSFPLLVLTPKGGDDRDVLKSRV